MENPNQHREVAGSRSNLDQPADIELPVYQVLSDTQRPSRLWWGLGVLGALCVAASLMLPWRTTAIANAFDAAVANEAKLLVRYEFTRGIQTLHGLLLVPVVLTLAWWLGSIQHKRVLTNRDYTLGWSLIVVLWGVALVAINTALFAVTTCAGCLASGIGLGIYSLIVGVFGASAAMIGLYASAVIRKRKQSKSEGVLYD